MTYMKKKLVVTVDVPDGATHLVISNAGVEWFKLEEWWKVFVSQVNEWQQIGEGYEPNGRLIEIEVIE